MKQFLKYFLSFVIFVLLCNVLAFSQSGQVVIYKDYRIDTLVFKHKEYNKVQNSIPGFRIQINSFTGNSSRNNAIDSQSKFIANYADAKVYVVFQSPYYVVRVGNFRTKLEAEAYRQKIKGNYPEAYIVKDNIELP
jgi:hypothetical protein